MNEKASAESMPKAGKLTPEGRRHELYHTQLTGMQPDSKFLKMR